LFKAVTTTFIIIAIAGASLCHRSVEAQMYMKASSFAVDALIRQADKNSESGRTNEALEQYSQAIKEQPNFWSAYSKRVLLLGKLGRYDEALNEIGRWNKLHPDGWSSYCHAKIMDLTGNYTEALADLDRSCNLLKNHQWLFLERARLRLVTGNYEKAREDSYKLLNLIPESIFSFELCSISDAICGKSTDAIFNLRRYVNVRLHSGSELRMLNQASSDRSDNVAMDKRVLKRLKSNSKSLNAQQRTFTRAILNFYLDDYAAALQELKLPQSTENINLKLLKFYCYVMQHDSEHAGAQIRQLAITDAKSELVMDALDTYHFETDGRQAGIKELKELVATNANNEAALNELAKIYRDLGNLPEALNYCDKALRFNQDNEELLLLKASLLSSENHDDEALKILSSVTRVDKECGRAFMRKATIYSHQEKWDKAIENLSEAIALKHNLIKALSARSVCYAAIHQDALARKDAEEVKELDPKQWQTSLWSN
jgi:tetratricopeptide (TPR) repeat protein